MLHNRQTSHLLHADLTTDHSMEAATRMAVLSQQLGASASVITMQPTAAPMEGGADYSVLLPEKLTADGPWAVHRWVCPGFRMVGIKTGNMFHGRVDMVQPRFSHASSVRGRT